MLARTITITLIDARHRQSTIDNRQSTAGLPPLGRFFRLAYIDIDNNIVFGG
jgi:hypothetical protein